MKVSVVDAIEGLPVFAKVAALVGVPSLVAVYLVWFVTMGVGANVASAATTAQRTNDAVHAVSSQVDKLMDTQTKLLRIMCVQIAKGDPVLVQQCLAE